MKYRVHLTLSETDVETLNKIAFENKLNSRQSAIRWILSEYREFLKEEGKE
jgi:hypothetical protein